jgi:mannose-6-phosphate isomerase-like protein (cupin superfamily)
MPPYNSVKQFNLKKEYYFAEGCFIIEMSNSPDDPDVSIARARVEPGKTTRWHRLRGITERYVIIQGKGRVEIDDLPPRQVNVGDVVIIPSLARQRICNNGDGDLIFFAICSPRFTEAAYESISGHNKGTT